MSLLWYVLLITNDKIVLYKTTSMYRVEFSLRNSRKTSHISWWRHQMETFPMLLGLCEENPPVSGVFASQKLVTWGFDVFFDLRLNKRLSKQLRRRWFKTHRAQYDVTVMSSVRARYGVSIVSAKSDQSFSITFIVMCVLYIESLYHTLFALNFTDTL